MNRSLKIIFIVILVLVIKAIVGAYYFGNKLLDAPANPNDTLRVTIPKGTNITEAISILEANIGLKPKIFFEYYTKYYQRESGKVLYAGNFEFPPGMTNESLIKGLFSSNYFKKLKVTYPEGIDHDDFVKISSEAIGLDSKKLKALFTSQEILEKYDIPAKNILGYIKPETYIFFESINEKQLVERLLKERFKLLTRENKAKMEKLGYSFHEILTLASIVEAETPHKEELRTVSGLYHNRLKKGMLLQADPTVQFAKGNKGRVLYKDLEIRNPYNTYVFAGLPPGPINYPGDAAIEATLNPEKHDYYYMVAIGDGSRKHNFAKTNAEHMANVREYRINRRNN